MRRVSGSYSNLRLVSFRVVAASLPDLGLLQGLVGKSPPRRFSPHAYSHQQPSFLLLLLLGAHILWHHLPAPSVISHASSNDAFPGPDSPAGMEILPFPPQILSHLRLPAEPPQTGRRVGSKHHSSTHQARVSLENIYIFVR